MRRAQREGAADAAAQRDFAKADDMFLFGLLAAHMLFVALSAPGATDLPTLQRLVEVTFRNDFSGLRCAHQQSSTYSLIPLDRNIQNLLGTFVGCQVEHCPPSAARISYERPSK